MNMTRNPLRSFPLVKESLKLLRVSIPTIIEIREHIPEKSGTIIFEPSLMHQVLMNLYTNAGAGHERYRRGSGSGDHERFVD